MCWSNYNQPCYARMYECEAAVPLRGCVGQITIKFARIGNVTASPSPCGDVLVKLHALNAIIGDVLNSRPLAGMCWSNYNKIRSDRKRDSIAVPLRGCVGQITPRIVDRIRDEFTVRPLAGMCWSNYRLLSRCSRGQSLWSVPLRGCVGQITPSSGRRVDIDSDV